MKKVQAALFILLFLATIVLFNTGITFALPVAESQGLATLDFTLLFPPGFFVVIEEIYSYAESGFETGIIESYDEDSSTVPPAMAPTNVQANASTSHSSSQSTAEIIWPLFAVQEGELKVDNYASADEDSTPESYAYGQSAYEVIFELLFPAPSVGIDYTLSGDLSSDSLINEGSASGITNFRIIIDGDPVHDYSDSVSVNGSGSDSTTLGDSAMYNAFLSPGPHSIRLELDMTTNSIVSVPDPMEELGKLLFFDTQLSTPPGQSCAACHAPEAGWTGPDSDINEEGSVYSGAVLTRFGNRKPPTAAYGGDSPVLYYDEDEETWIGGMFWDGRATGWTLGDPLAEQAMGPFLNTVEQNNLTKRLVCIKVRHSDYAGLFEEVWGPGSLDFVHDIDGTYERIALSIAAYERSSEVNPFSSKYDYFLKGETELTDEEQFGLELFEGKAMCSACHPSEEGPGSEPPLFTDFTYDNLGVPKNPQNPFYSMPPYWNPDGEDWVDYGLGGFLKSAGYEPEVYEPELGKVKVPTLRNVDKRPYENFIKAYSHNGTFKSLKEIIHFYNTRDVQDWPPPEVPMNINQVELGDLGLTDGEEDAIVAFLKTLTDGFILQESFQDQPPKDEARTRTISYYERYQSQPEMTIPWIMPSMDISSRERTYNGSIGGQTAIVSPWSQAGNGGPPWYQDGLGWFKSESGGPWWWQASLLVSPVGPIWYQDGVNGPLWYQTLEGGPWWASMLP